MRCLLVDDHESVRMGVTAILSSRPNIQICGEASNGKEAVEKARELKPDLIILDVTMPVLDGINSAKEIRTVSTRSADPLFLHARWCVPRSRSQTGGRPGVR